VDVQQNDPSEPLELFDAGGRPLGVAKSREAVHRDGDWHQAFHCWIVRPGARPEIVLQRRSLAKDTFPGAWDAAAAGHWRFGESAAEAAREIAEELGLAVPFSALTLVGSEKSARHHPNGLIDREHHRVYRLVWTAPLSSFRPDPAEVAGLAAFPAQQLIDLADGRRPAVSATEAVSVSPDGRLQPAQVSVSRADLVPYSAARLSKLLGGIPPVA
jgi:isopentenyldiphosphate isomerase